MGKLGIGPVERRRWQGRNMYKERNRKTWKKCVDGDVEVLGLHPE